MICCASMLIFPHCPRRYCRFIESFGINKSLGVLRIILGQMASDIQQWFIITMLFTVGMGVAFTILMPGQIMYHT